MAYLSKETPAILSHKTSNALPGCLNITRYRTCRTASTQDAATYTPVTTSTTDSSPHAVCSEKTQARSSKVIPAYNRCP